MSELRLKKNRRAKVETRVNEAEALITMPLEMAWDYFINAKLGEGVRKRTHEDYANTWRYFTTWLNEREFEIVNVSDITPTMCREYIKYLTYDAPKYKGHKHITSDHGLGLSAATINMRIRALKVAFNFWKRENIVRISAMDNIKCQKTDEDKIESFTDEQVDAMLNACDQRKYVGFRDYVFQICLLDTGMRLNELLSLELDSIDVKTRTIHLSAEFNKNRRYRVIPISAMTLKLIFELVDENKAHFPKQKKLFLSCFGEVVKDTQMNKRLKGYGDMTGVGKEIRSTAHTYRHTFARNYILNGGDPYTLMRILGHSSLHMTRRYIQMTDGDLSKQHDSFSPINKLRTRLR